MVSTCLPLMIVFVPTHLSLCDVESKALIAILVPLVLLSIVNCLLRGEQIDLAYHGDDRVDYGEVVVQINRLKLDAP